MNFALAFGVFVALCCSVDAIKSPQVQVYSRDPGEFGNDNVLICHVSNFHPPDITIEILKDEEVIPGAVQTDLTFKQDWHFHLTKSVEFKPSSGEKYKCRVTHGTNRKDYIWGDDV
uniref:Beta-2-microglobulin n=1 Tax=Nothobranchius furzeri TaxID=105023 RepID=A0A8C6KFN7_NOTFU